MKRVSTRKLRRASKTAQPVVRNRRPRPLGVSLARFGSMVAIAGALFAGAGSSQAANFNWDGGTNFWDDAFTANWNGGGTWANSFDNIAIFGGVAGTVTLQATMPSAGGLVFNTTGYNLTAGTLTLGAPTGFNSPIIAVNGLGTRATIDSIVAGTSGFTKTGNGTLQLTNSANSFSGDIAITAGNLVITSTAQLGTGTTAIGVTGIANTGSPGFSGGSLILAGTTPSGGFTLSREVSTSGRGPGAANASAGVVSVGYNTIAGGLTLASTASEGRAIATHGITTIGSGGMYLGTGNANLLFGNGNWIVSGQVTSSEVSADRLIKTGTTIATTLWLQNANNSFNGTIRVDSGTVRVSTDAALGRNRSTQAFDFNGGRLEVRSDAPDFSARNLNIRGNTSQLFVDRAIGGTGLNQNFVFGNLNNSSTNGGLTMEGRNGSNLSITAPLNNGVPGVNVISWVSGGVLGFTNAGNGLYTINASINRLSETSARTLTLNAAGEILLTGNILQAGTGAVSLSKTGTGTLTIGGALSTATGTTTINNGTVSIGNVAALPTGALLLGNATTGNGTLKYTGAAATLANPITLNVTTANAYLEASGTGALTVSGAITNAIAGAHSLILGGTSQLDNTITSVIPVNTTPTQITSLQKLGTGTWVVSPTANNTFTGGTTVGGGVLKLQEAAGNFDILPNAGAVTFNVDTFRQAAGGTLQYRGANDSVSTEDVGALTATAGHGLVQVVPGSGTGTATLTFASLAARTAGASLNVADTGVVRVTGTAGFLNSGTYFNDTNFAYSGAGTTLRAPNYGGDAGFVNAAAGVNTLTAASHNQITGTITAQATVAVNSLKNSGAFNLTLGTGTAAGTLTIGTAAGTGIIQDGGSATISGFAGSTIVPSAAANDFAIRVTGGNTLAINVPLTTSTTGLTKSGAGTLELGAINTITSAGQVRINEGTLRLAGAGTLGATDIDLVIRQAGTFDLNGVNVGTLASGGIDILNGAGAITNTNATGALLRVGNGGTSGYFTGTISDGAGTVSLVKGGAGTLSLTNNASTFSTLTLGAGTVAFALPEGTTSMPAGSPSPIGSGATAAGLVFNGGTLQYTGATATIFAPAQSPSITTNRQFTLAGNGTIESSGTYGNNVGAGSQNNATLILSSTADVSFSGAGVRTLTLAGTSLGDNELRAHLVDNPNAGEALSLTKAGGGLWILNPSSSNTYTGATTINGTGATAAGVLRVGDDAGAILGLPTSSNLSLGAATGPGVLETSGTFARAMGLLANEVQIGAQGGGFAASTSKLTVNLGGAAAPIVLGAAPTAGSQLVLSSSTAMADVELVNAINLGTAARTIRVDDNGSTGLDFATASGVITGGAGGTLSKTGPGTLILGDANEYVANTLHTEGHLVVTSIGASGATATSVGTNVGGGIFSLGSGGTGTPNLLYVGPGETTTRGITLNSTTGTISIDATGSGALVLQNVITNGAAGAKTFQLRGTNTDGNMLANTAALANNGGNLSITKSDGGVWILNPAVANTFTGNINANGGMLGLTADGIGTAAALTFSNGGIFAYGGPLVKTVPITLANNATAVFGGSNAITITGAVTKAAGANDQNISNNLEGGALLTINGNFVNSEPAATRTINIRGFGSTVWNGVIANNSTTGQTAWNIALAPTASFTMAGGSANTYSGTTTLTDGILIIDKAGALGTGTFAFNGGTLNVGGSLADLTGANAINNTLAINATPPRVDGAKSIEFTGNVTMGGGRNFQNELTGGATLTLSGATGINNTASSTFTLYGAGPTVISMPYNAGTGTSGLQLAGTGTLQVTGTNLATGALTATRGTITLSGVAGGSWNAGTATVNPTGTLTLDNSGGNNPAGRLADGGAFAGQGGTLNIINDGVATSETTGALTLNGVQTSITMSGAGTTTLTFASAAFANTGSSLDLSSIAGLGGANKVLITAALPANALINSIMPRTFINGGADFATYNAVNGVQAFAAYNVSNNLNTALVTDTMDLTASAATTANRQVNAIKINGTGLVVSGAAANRLTLGTNTANASAAAILNTGGNNALNISEVAFGANTGYIQVAPGTTLTVNGDLSGNTAFAKVLSGALTFGAGARSFVSSTQNLLEGTINLNGGADTLLPNTGQLTVGVGATLNLNGGGQYVGLLTSQGALPGGGGTINGGGAIVTNGGGTFGGVITSGTSLGRVGGGTLAFESPQTYTGTTLLMGGTTTLENEATLANGTTSDINLNNATLFLGNNNSFQIPNNDRVGDAIPINLRGGTLSVTSRLSTPSTEAFGTINALQGANTITATGGGGTFGSVDLTIASLVRTAGAGVVVNFSGTNLGQQGNSARIFFTTPLTTVAGGALGGWAVANSTDFAAYNTALGVGIVGTGGFAGYDSAFGTGNITELPGAPNSSTTATLPGNTTTGLLKFAGNTFNNLEFTASGDVLDVEHGGVLRSNNNFGTSIGTAAIRGVLTAGGTDPTARELFIFNNGSANPTFTGAATTIGSPVVTGINTTGLQPGMAVTNANFPAGTRVLSVQNSGQVTLTSNATASATTQTLTAGALDGGSTTNLSPVITMASTVGVSPGMTLTGTGIPANTFVVSVDSPTQLTLSQNATANAVGTITFTAGLSNMVINSVIANNTTAPAVVTLVKSGLGVLTLTAPNTYTGGTIVNSPLNLASPGAGLIATNVVLPAGGITINNGTITMLTNQGQIAATNAVTLRGGSVLTLAGNNTLDSLAFDNNGGTATPTVTSLANSLTIGLLTLTNATPITVTSSNPASVATISGNLDIGTGAKTINTPAIQVGGVTVTSLVPTLNISAGILSPGVTLNKTGLGLLQLGGQSTFTGGVNLTAGGIVIGASSTPASGGAGLTSGPLGSGTLTASAGTTLVATTSAAIGNDIVFNGTPTFDSVNNTVWTMTLNGSLTGPGMASPTPTIEIANPGLTVALLGNIPNIATITSFNKTGLGTLVFNSTGYTGNYDAGALGNGLAVQLLHDGTGLNLGNSTPENIVLPGTVTFDAIGTGTITVGRAGGTLPFNLAANKIINPGAINTVATNGLIVANNAGYGLEVSEALALAGTPTFTVNTATASNVTQGLYLTGDLSGSGFIKAGAGTLVVNNATPANNTFTGNIDIRQGVVSVNDDAQLGNAANQILLNPTAGTSTLRATGTFATSRTIDLTVTANTRAIEVTSGNTLTLNSAFGVTAPTAGLIKADLGTLELAAANGGWSGPLTITGGAVSTALATSLGTGTITVNAPAAALQLNGGITVANPITIDSLSDGRTVAGINLQGAIQGVTGANIISNTVTANATTGTDNQTRNFGFGANAGASLSFSGPINFNHPTGGSNRNVIVYLGGAGDLTLNNVLNNTNASPGNSFVFKNGNGTMTLTAANAIQDSEVRVYRGTAILDGAATFGTGGTQVQAWQNGTLTFDNSTTNTPNRFSNRVVQIGGGTLNFLPNALGTSHVSTGALQISQGANTINLAGGGNQTVTFGSLTQNAGATLDMTGIFGTANNKLTFTTAPANVPAGAGGLLPRITTNANEFATYAAATGVGTFTAYAPVMNILSAGATQTYKATSATANSLIGSQTVNAINLNSGPLIGNSPNLGGLGGFNPPLSLTLTSGAILANGTGAGASSSISVPIVALAGVEGIFHVAGGQTLSVTSGFSGTGGMTKSLGGTLNFNQQQYISGNTIVNGGTLNLQSGATNTLLFNNGLGINSGATVDLKNGVQFIGSLFSANGGGNTDLGGGTLTNVGAQATLVTNSNANFNGQITGTIYLNKTGTNSLNLQTANSYTGDTLITGGTLTLQDDGTIAGTTAIGINYGTLNLNDNGLRPHTDRVPSVPITMKGGNITLNGRAQTNTTETLGGVTLVEGHNILIVGRNDPGINSVDLTFASLARSVGSIATLRFQNLGATGLIGSQSRVFFTANPTLTNNILGPWAIVDREYATYDPTYGISALGQVGVAGYAGSGLNTSPLATDNVRLATAGGITIMAGNTVVNTFNLSQNTANAILDLGGNTLRVQGGGLLIGQGTDNTTVTINNGTITSGTLGAPSDLYLIHAPFDNDGRTATINAVIADNTPVTGPVRLILSGDPSSSSLTLAGTNTYTGGTVINQGNRILGATGTLGSGGITVNAATFTQAAGGVIPAQTLTMTAGGTVTLAGNNTLTGITFDNMGGGTPTLNPTGVLTLTGGITASTMNAGAVATIANGTLDLNAAGSYAINVGATLVNGQDVAPWQSGLTINSVIQNGGIAKSGNGMLQLGGQSTFSGGVNVSAGGLIIAANSTPNGLLDPVTTGPLGTGAVTMAANTTVVAGAANTQVSNNFTFLGDTVFNGINNLTLNGITTLPAIWNATVTAPQVTVTIGDASPSGSGDVINKSGLGFLSVGNYAGTINVTGGLFFNADGNTLGTQESLNLTGNVVLTGDTAITVNRSGGAPNARNKILQKVDLTNPGSILAVSNQSGYGLEFTGTTTMNGLSHFSVGVATASNVVQGLILTGPVTDLGGNLGIIKSGPGTLVLSDATNSFGGVGSTIDILNGVLSVPNDGALGNASNTVTLDVDATTGVGFRSTGTFSTSRTFNLNQANNAMEVTAGNVLTLTTPFVLSAAANTLTKNDNGVLAINANNTGWTGAITINAGAIRVMDANAIGSGAVTINNTVGSALQLDGGVNFPNPVTLALNGLSGINTGGVLQSVTGNNTFSGLITQTSGNAVTYGADAGATLNFTGGISTTNSSTFNVGAGGNIFITAVAYGNGLAGGPSLNKIGNGTLTLSVNSAAATAPALNVSAGTMVFNSGGVLGGGATTTAALIDVGGTLTLDNTTAAGGSVDNRLGGSTRPITFRGGNFNLIGTDAGAATTTETLDAPTFSAGFSTITVSTSGTNQASLLFDATSNIAANPQNATSTTGGAPSGTSVLFRGTSLGTAAGPGVSTIRNTGTDANPTRAGFNFNGATGATGSTTKGIMPWAILETTDSGTGTTARFATGDAAAAAVGTTAILRQLSNSEMSAANAAFAASVNELVTASRTVTATIAPNSVTMESAGELVISPFVTLTLASGGYLLKSTSGAGITGGILSQPAGNSPFNMWAVQDTTITSVLNGGNGTGSGNVGFIKAGAGILTLSTPTTTTTGLFALTGLNTSVNSMSGQTVINQGTLKLDGGLNTIQANNFIQINQGGVLDLNGNSQQVLSLFSTGAVDGSGGIINSSTGTGSLVVNQDNAGRNWAGSIQGAVNFTRSGQNTMTLYSPQTYTGTTLLNGGTTVLRDNAALTGTGTLDINYATLLAENGGTMDLTDRIENSKAITIRGGTLTIQGRAQTASTETLGAVSIDQGFVIINPLVGGTGINSTDVILASLSRPAGSSATLIVQGTNLGTIGSNSRVTVGTLNGVATLNPTYSRNGSGLTENLVGGWAENGNDFLTYIPGLGLAALNQVGAPQYDLNNSFSGALSTDNIRLTATTNVTLGGAAANAVSMSGSAINLNFLGASDILNITSGGLIGPNNNQSIGTTVLPGVLTAGGPAPALNSDLYVFNRGNTLTINSKISDNTSGGGSAVRAVFTALGGTINLVNPANDYTGGTVLNAGTLSLTNTAATPVIPAGGLEINNGTVTMNNFAGQIAASNVVTLNGTSTISFFSDNTIEGLILNNIGGGSGNLTVNSFTTATVSGAGSTGVLSIGNSGIVATSSNVASTGIIIGRADFGATAKTINVAPINTNGVDVAPLQAAFALQGVVGTTGGITKTGNGVLQFNAQAHYTGPTTVNVGGIRTGVTNGGSRFSALTLNGAATTFNISGANTTWGSLAGSGTIFNTGGAATLTVGFNNDTTTTFSGQLARFNDAVVNAVFLQKVGTGELVMTGAQSFATGTTGTITVNGGTLRYLDSGEAFNGTAASGGGTFSVNNGGVLALDNTGTSNVNSRLGLDVTGTLNVQGGRLTINGTSTPATPTTEAITTFNVVNGGGRIELSPDAANPLTLALTTLNTANPSGSLVIGGIIGAASAAGVANVTITTPNLIAGQGTGANGTSTMPVRHDILADASVSGLGTGFLVKDSVTNNYRALGTDSAGAAAPGELAAAISLPLAAGADDQNVGLSSAQTIGVNSLANTLTISGTASVGSALGAAFGNYGPAGGLLTLSLSQAAASLTLAGATGTMNVGSFGSTSTGTTPYVHVITGGTLNVNSAFALNGTGGLMKADGGLLKLNNLAYYTGATTVNGGTLSLDSGTVNTLVLAPTAGAATVSQLNLNGSNAVVDLNGRNQAIGALTSINPLPGLGGTIQSTGGSATLSVNGTGTFSGVITDAIALTRAGNNTTTLTNANTYTGATIVRGGVLELRDSGAISSTAGLTLNYGTLNWNNFGLNAAGTPNPTRVAATNPVTLQGGAFTINGAGSTDTIATLNTATVTGGANSINTLPFINEGSTVKLTIGNLVRNAANHSGVNFNGFSLNNSSGSNTLGGQGLTTNSNIILNQINGAASPLSFNLVNATTTASSATVNVPSTAGLTVGMSVYGSTIPLGRTIASIVNGTTFTLNSGTSVTAGTGLSLQANNMTDNLLGGWAVADGSAFATYNSQFGVIAMGNTYGGFAAPGFTGTDISAVLVNTGNYSDGATTRSFAAGAVAANSLRFAPTATSTITFPTTTTVAVDVGIITNGSSTTLLATDATNTLTGTGSDLFLYANQNTLVVQPQIIGTAALVSNGPATLSLRPQFASNTYSGGTYANAGTLNLQAAATFIAIPGDLTVNNAAVTMSTVTNQIATTSNLFINGGGSVTLGAYTTGPTQTLSSVTFTNDGGNANPTLSLGTPTTLTSTLILSSATPITSTNNSLAATPTISTGAATLTALQFSDANPVITVNDGLAETELTISAPITQHANMLSLSKSGLGALALSGASTFTTGLALNQGSLILGASSTPSTVGAVVTSGPLGTGALNIAAGTTLLSDGSTRTIANTINVNGDFTLGGRIAGNNVVLNGAMNLGAAARTLTVASPAVTSTIAGAITSTAVGTALTKAGPGTLIITQNASTTFGGAGVAVTGGILKGAGAANALPVATNVAISAGAGYDLNNFDQTLDGISGAGFITQSGASTKTLAVNSIVTNSNFSGVLTDNRLGNAASHLALTKNGAGTTLTLSGAEANTHSGVTTVTAGILELNKTANLSIPGGSTGGGAIGGDLVASKVTPDVVINGGTLRLGANHQLDNSVFVNMTSGTFNVNGKTETIHHFVNSGGAYISPRGSALTVTDPDWTAGTNDVFGNDSYGVLNISGGTNTIHGDETSGFGAGTLTVGGAGGLNFSGAGSPTLIVSGDHTTAGGLILTDNVTSTATSLARITNGQALQIDGVTPDVTQPGAFAGYVDLGASNRTFTVSNGVAGVDMEISAKIISSGGGLIKAGAGQLKLSGVLATPNTANTYTGPTTVQAGILEISGSIAGTTGITSTSSVQVDNTGTLLLSGASEQVNNSASLNLNGGTLAFGTQSGVTETLGALTLNANSILDFGVGDSNTFSFSSLSITGGSILSIYNWTGTPYGFPPEDDTVGNGHFATQDRLLFNTDPSLSSQPLSQINFYSDNGGNFLGSGAQIVFGGNYEIVPVPEPSSTALLGAAGLLALVGYRERRRFSRKSKQA